MRAAPPLTPLFISRPCAQESDKVISAIAAMHDAEADAAVVDARAQAEAMEAAAARRAARLGEVAAKGHRELEKIDRAAAKLQSDSAAKAAKMEAEAAAAAERRAAKISDVKAKGAAESEKVAAAHWLPVGTPSKAIEPPESPTTQPQASRRRMLRLTPPAPAIASGLAAPGMLLALMRGGAPNAEVLLASTVEEYLALGVKYGIPLQHASSPPSLGGGMGGSPPPAAMPLAAAASAAW